MPNRVERKLDVQHLCYEAFSYLLQKNTILQLLIQKLTSTMCENAPAPYSQRPYMRRKKNAERDYILG